MRAAIEGGRAARWAAALVALGAFSAASLGAAEARAQGGRGDGAYGRLDGDLSLTFALGGGVALGADPSTAEARAALGGEIDLRYLDVAGLRLGAYGVIEATPASGHGRAFLAVELRPIFLGRFFLNAWLGDWFWDLLIDSLSVSLGVAAAPLDDRPEEHLGAALFVGVGADLPLARIEQSSLLSLAFRADHVHGAPTQSAGPGVPLSEWVLGLALSFRSVHRAGLPVWEPRRYATP